LSETFYDYPTLKQEP